VCGELSLVDAGDLIERDHHVGPVREALEGNLVLVDEQGVLIEDEVPLDDVVVLAEELADGPLQDDGVFFALVHRPANLVLLFAQHRSEVLQLRHLFFIDLVIGDVRQNVLQVVLEV